MKALNCLSATQKPRFLELLQQERDSYLKFFARMSEALSLSAEKAKAQATEQQAALQQVSSTWLTGTVQAGCEPDTLNQNLCRHGCGRMHVFSKTELSEKLPSLFNAAVRRMCAEESLPVDSVATLMICDMASSTSTSVDTRREMSALFKLMPCPKLVFHSAVFSEGGKKKTAQDQDLLETLEVLFG